MHRLPLDAGGKRRAAAAAQAGVGNGAHDVERLHGERIAQPDVTAMRDIVHEARRIDDSQARAGETLLAREIRMSRDVAEAQRMRATLEHAGVEQFAPHRPAVTGP